MRRKNRRDAIAGFRADKEDALCYVGTNALFSLRDGAEKYVKVHRGRKDNDAVCLRQQRRTKAHNGICVPLSYAVKPRSADFSRETIRRPAYTEFLVRMASFGILYD